MSTQPVTQDAMWRRQTRDVARPEPVTISVDGRAIAAHPGESVATALLAAGLTTFRYSPRGGFPRAVFCMMGSCQECVVRIDGRRAPACQTPVAAGMAVETGAGSHG